METAQVLCERLRERGLVVTPQRRVIFEVLEKREDHPCAEAVYEEVRKRLPDVSLATVYKTLKELVSMGETPGTQLRTGLGVASTPRCCDHSPPAL